MKEYTMFRTSLALCAVLVAAAQEPISLPAVPSEGASLVSALKARATVRTLAGPAPTLAETAQLLWAAQGENRPGHRTVPSARATYPLQLFVLTAGAPGLAAGMYRYVPAGHKLARAGEAAPLGLDAVKGMQPWIKDAPAVFVVAGDASKVQTGGKSSTLSLAYYEAGSAGQSLLLQAAALGLGAGTAAGIDLDAVTATLKLPAGVQAYMLLPVGHVRK
jgi:SagB-type dehydrogenase family enzyme